MNLKTFEKSHKYLDEINIPKLDEYKNNVIIDRVDFTEQENNGDVKWRDDGVYIKIQNNYRRGFMYNKTYKVSKYGNPKFHIFECSVIEKFKQKGTLSEYYFWSNSNIVTLKDRDNGELYENQKLELCQHCKKVLNDKKILDVHNTEDYHELLNINDLAIETNTGESKTDIFNRPFNWRSISKAYRKEQNYTCEECGFGGKQLNNNYDKRYIHTHHIDGYALLNTHRDNLKSLCILCHYHQDEHHQSNFEKPRLKIELVTFIKEYKSKLIEIGNKHITKTEYQDL